jgi:DNA-directed RNA polymerase subunit RPC12/RpoP
VGARMFDSHLDTQLRLNYSVRGPEWGFAIPAGDLDALAEVMARCSVFWNGPGSLIVAVGAGGELDPRIEPLLETRPIENCWLHPSLGEAERSAVGARLPSAKLWEGFDQYELHPLLLATNIPDPMQRPSLLIPEPGDEEELRLLTLALWGAIPEDDLFAWGGYYNVGSAPGEVAWRALVDGQVGPLVSSPLRLCEVGLRVNYQQGPQEWPTLFVFSQIDFGSLVDFWNLRSRSMNGANGAPVIGMTLAMLGQPEAHRALQRWTVQAEGVVRVPDVLVASAADLRPAIDTELVAAGFERDEGSGLEVTMGASIDPGRPASYRHGAMALGGRFVRGAAASQLVAVSAGSASLRLPQPAGLDIRSGHHLRLVLRNLPAPLPITGRAAAQMHPDGIAYDGLMLNIGAVGVAWDIDVRLLERFEALDAWAQDTGGAAALTQDGRYAEALLRRLGSLVKLEPLTDPLRIQILRLLAPRSRLKLAQRLVAEAAEKDGTELSEQQLLAGLDDVALFLELEAKAATDIASELHVKLPEVLAALGPLVDLGLITRGRAVRCPECNYGSVFALAAIDERVECPACGHRFALPVSTPDGRREPGVVYRLDGLMARIMDQNLLPVLLALRSARAQLAAPHFFAWPGVLFEPEQTDVDLLCSNGESVFCFEVKDNAASLSDDQLADLIALSERLGAQPSIAGLRGSFSDKQRQEVVDHGGMVLDSDQLLPTP